MSLPCGNYGSDPLLLYIMSESGKRGTLESIKSIPMNIRFMFVKKILIVHQV